MPNSHYDVKLISRSLGQSSVAAAAYRSGQALHDDRLGRSFTYTNKRDVRHTEIIVPDGAPAWMADRGKLFNGIEAGEKRRDAQLVRAFTAALPRELDLEQQIALTREYVTTNFTQHGMVADIAIHESVASDGLGNPHIHLLVTLRDIEGDGFGKKNRTWNSPQLVTAWRESWERITNFHLEAAGVEERVSLRSYEAQGIDQIPEFHLGYEAAELEAQGIQTEAGDRLRDIRHQNQLRDLTGDLIAETELWEREAFPEFWAEPEDLEQLERTPDEKHDSLLAAYIEASVDYAAETANAIVVRFNQWWDRAAEEVRNVYDRVTAAFEGPDEPGYDHDPEPGRGIGR